MLMLLYEKNIINCSIVGEILLLLLLFKIISYYAICMYMPIHLEEIYTYEWSKYSCKYTLTTTHTLKSQGYAVIDTKVSYKTPFFLVI